MRRLAFAALFVLAFALPLPASAHGLGGRLDLPVPISVFVGAAAAVLVFTFAALAVLWPEPRLQAPADLSAGRRLGWLRNALAVLGAAALGLTVVAGIVGPDNATSNPAAVMVFVGFWLIVPFVAAVAVDFYPALSPWPRLARVVGLAGEERPDMLDRLGYRPGVAVLLAFTWFELIAPDNGPRAVAVAALIYTGYLLAMSAWLGPGTASEVGDGFAVYARFLGAMAPYSFHDGVWRRTGWLRRLVALPERPGLVAFVVAMIGTVTYDGAASTAWWATAIRDPFVTALRDAGLSLQTADIVAGSVCWLAVVVAVGGAYLAAAAVAARLADGDTGARRVASRFAHTLVPIGFAYAFAHYFTLVVFEGQLFLSTMSDPFGLGWDLFGTADRAIDFSLIQESRAWVWYIQVGVIVAGHMAGVTLAHDRALADFPRAHAVASQYAMLVLMVALTGLGLVILAAG